MAQLEVKYNVPSFPGAFSGINKFYRGLKESDVDTTRNKVKDFLSTQDSYTLHYPARRRIKRNRVVVGGVSHLFESDLLSMSSLSSFNDGHKYIISAVDALSKFAYCELLKTKQADEVVLAFRKILNKAAEDGRLPCTHRHGGEYVSAKWNKLMREYGIEHYTAKNTEIKATLVERFQKTSHSKENEEIRGFFTGHFA